MATPDSDPSFDDATAMELASSFEATSDADDDHGAGSDGHDAALGGATVLEAARADADADADDGDGDDADSARRTDEHHTVAEIDVDALESIGGDTMTGDRE